MKTTVELPEKLYLRARSEAAARGVTLKLLVQEALDEKLNKGSGSAEPAWMKGFGGLADLREESARIRGVIEEEFEQIEPEDKR